MAKRASLAASLLVALGVATGCVSRGGPVPYEPKGFVAPDVEGQPVASEMLPIGALDKVRINVFQVDSLSGEFRVDQTGMIDYPLLGNLQAQGRTTKELSHTIAAKLSERYLQAPNVQVAVIERAEQTITVDGSVKDPGVFKIKGPTTLLQAVAMAHGTAEDANTARVIVFRTVRGERMAGAFDLRDIRRAKAENPPVYGNDIVIVDGNRAQRLFRDLMTSLPLLSILRPY